MPRHRSTSSGRTVFTYPVAVPLGTAAPGVPGAGAQPAPASPAATARTRAKAWVAGADILVDSSRFDVRIRRFPRRGADRSEEHTSELQSQSNLVCRLLLEKKK